jgi:hypothetical protein
MALVGLVATLPWTVGVPDTWTFGALGNYRLDHGIPRSDPFSYLSSSSDQPYTEHGWGSGPLAFGWHPRATLGMLLSLCTRPGVRQD